MSKLPRDAVKQYFPFYPAQWLTSRRLRVCSPAARGVLIDLMAMAWEDGGKVCEDLDVLAVSMGLTPESLQGLLDELTRRERITVTTRKGSPPTIHVPPLEAIHAEAIAYIAARQADGKRGADARYKGAHRDPIGTLQGAYPLTGPELTGPDRTRSDQIIPEEKKGKTPAPRFVPPTAAEVQEYMNGIGKPIDAEAFLDYWQSAGWKRKSGPVKDWQSTARTWYRNMRPEEHAALTSMRARSETEARRMSEAETHKIEKAAASQAMARIDAMIQDPTPELLERAEALAVGATAALSHHMRLKMAAAEIIEGEQ